MSKRVLLPVSLKNGHKKRGTNCLRSPLLYTPSETKQLDEISNSKYLC